MNFSKFILHPLFWRRTSTEKITESGNTGVIAQSGISTLKGRDPAVSGVTSGANKRMSMQISRGATPSGIKRQAAKAATVLGAIALIVALSVPTIGSVGSRASADHAPLEALFGTVVEVKLPDQVAVATDSNVTTVLITEDTVFTGDVSTIEDIAEGDRFVASVHVSEDGVTTADRVLIIPDLTQSVTRHILGVIVDHEDNVITVQDHDGNSISIDIPEGVEVPGVGTVVIAVVQLDRATGRLVAQAFDLAEDVVQRIQDALDRATDEDRIAELEELLERARDQHLSALEKAREALERAQNAVQAALEEREEAERRLREVQAQFEALRQRYIQEASERDERLPQLRTQGVLGYDEDAWLEESGEFTLAARTSSFDDGDVRTFTWTQDTLAIVPVEVTETDPDSPAITVTTARSVALPLNEVKSLVPSGSNVIVQYDPNTEPAVATLITVLPPELPDAIKDALERERLRSISGFITLVEDTPDLDETTGVIVVANNEHNVKVAAKVTEQTEIEVDGEKAEFGDLAAGMAVEVDFAEAEPAEDNSLAAQSAALAGRLDALRIRARTVVADDEVQVAGLIAGVDIETRTVGVLTRDGEIVRAHVPNGAVIIKNGVEARFGALETGDLVLDATRYNLGQMVFTRLVVQSPRSISFSGAIKGIDRDPNRLTITTVDGDVLVVYITDSTDIFNEANGRVNFSNLRVGNRVLKGEALPVQRDGHTLLIASTLIVGDPAISTARGVVTRVDADAGALQITVSSSAASAGAFTDAVSAQRAQLVLSVAENNSSVMFKNDFRIKTLETVEIGDIVESVSFVRSTGVITRMSVVSPNLQRTRGTVSAVANNGIAIETTNGRSVGLVVNDETVVTLNGRRVSTLRSINRGDVVAQAVYITRENNSAEGIALRLTIISQRIASADGSPPATSDPDDVRPSVVTSVSGVIQEIADDKWTIGGREFLVTSQTRFFGERPQVGLVAKAVLVLNEDGVFVATSVSVAGRPDTNPSTRPVEVLPVEPGDENQPDLVRIFGRVQAIEEIDETTTIVVIDGVKITLFESTVVLGEPEIGANALAVVRRSPSGNVAAVSIVFSKRNATEDGNEADITPGTGPIRPDEGDGDDTDGNTPPTNEDGTGGETGDGGEGTEDTDSTGTSPGNGGPSNVEPTEPEEVEPVTVTVRIEQIDGRVMISGGRIYLLKISQALNARAGDLITVTVREVERENLTEELSDVDLFMLINNPLYTADNVASENPIFVAE